MCERSVIKVETVLYICSIIILIFGSVYSYQTLYVVLGLFFTRKYKKTENKHKYAVIVSARNEEKVIGQFIDSVKKQDYPSDMVTVFVVADNCSDKTASIAREKGAVCYERHDTDNCTKGFALQYLFKCIDRDYGTDSFEAYILFDADNLLKRDFISRMNEAFDSGEKIVTSYRNSKNLDDGFISAGYALHWVRTSRFISRARSFLGVTTWVQGCGFLFSNELVKTGWNFTSLTEDRAFSIDAVTRGYRIVYQNEAEFYDEQPTRFSISMRQRIRWAKGHLQAFAESWHLLLRGVITGKGFLGKFNCLDMFITLMPYSIVAIPVKLVRLAASAVLLVTVANGTGLLKLIPMAFEILVFEHFGVIPMAIFLFILEYKRLAKIKWYRALYYSVMFSLFGIVGDIATWVALFSKVTWKPIPHEDGVHIDDVEERVLISKK